jgi:hypothetical protein
MGRIRVGGEESAEAVDLCQGSVGSGGFSRNSDGIRRWCLIGICFWMLCDQFMSELEAPRVEVTRLSARWEELAGG